MQKVENTLRNEEIIYNHFRKFCAKLCHKGFWRYKLLEKKRFLLYNILVIKGVRIWGKYQPEEVMKCLT
jgi:hypothetical protein